MVVLSLLVCVFLFLIQIRVNKRNHSFYLFNPKYIFELYYILALPFSLFVADVMGVKSTDVRINYLFNNIDTTRVSIYIIVGFIFFLIGTESSYRARFRPWRFLDIEWRTNRVKIVLPILVAIGYGSFILLMNRNGGIIAFILNIQTFRNTGLIGQGFLIYPATGLLRMCFLIYLIEAKKNLKRKKQKFKVFAMLLICTFPTIFLGFRSTILCIFLELIAVYHTFIHKIKIRNMVLFFLFALLFFIVYGFARELTTPSDLRGLSNHSWVELLFNSMLRVRGGEIFGVVIRQLNLTRDFQFGYRTIVEALTIIIPHSIWPNKPVAKSILFSETFFGLNGGVSPTILAELYWDFGIFGVTIGMLFFGLLMSLVTNSILAQKTNPSILLFAELYYQSFLFAEAISGQLNSFVAYFAFFLIVNSLLVVRLGNRR